VAVGVGCDRYSVSGVRRALSARHR
jgi:hypothetical protein